MLTTLSLLALVPAGALAQVSGVNPNKLPYRTEAGNGQFGFNNCSQKAGSAYTTSKCQTLWINSINDFCLWAPPSTGKVGNEEEKVVAYCMQADHGARLLPKGIITSATFIKTPQYVQIKGTLSDQTKIHIPGGDSGGELDPHGYNSYGNPIGGIVIAPDPQDSGKETQVVEWISFIGNNQFCIRACYNSGATPFQHCMHIYDQMGCDWVMPDKTPKETFQVCHGKPDRAPGIFTKADGSESTWSQGTKPTPTAFKPAATSNCSTLKSLTYHTYAAKAKRDEVEDAPAVPTPATNADKRDAHAAHQARATGHAAKMERRAAAKEAEL